MFATTRSGFSLIELLIVVALIAILSSIAMPAYQQWVLRSNRSDALAALAQIQVQQEHFFLQNQRYAGNAAELRASPPTGLGFSTGLSERGLYQLTLSSRQPGDYLAIATALNTQLHDLAACQTLALDEHGGHHPRAASACWR